MFYEGYYLKNLGQHFNAVNNPFRTGRNLGRFTGEHILCEVKSKVRLYYSTL